MIKLSETQASYVCHMFTKLIPADDLGDSFDALGIEKSSNPLLKVKELDLELIDAVPGGSYLAKSGKAFTAVEVRVIKAANPAPAPALWGASQEARSKKSQKVDLSQLIPLAEASVCSIGQASVDVKFQKRMAVASKFMKDKVRAKKVLSQNEQALEKDKQYLFGFAFTKKTV